MTDQNDLNQQNVKDVAEYLLNIEIIRNPHIWTSADKSTIESRKTFIQKELSQIDVDQYYTDYLANRSESGEFASRARNIKTEQINPKYLEEWNENITMLDHHCQTYEQAIRWNETDIKEGRKKGECRLCMYPIHTYKRPILTRIFVLNQLEKEKDFSVY